MSSTGSATYAVGMYSALRSFNNRSALARSAVAGCYSCLGSFLPREVVSWAHEATTAVCPLCEADTVLPGVTDARSLLSAREALYGDETIPAVLSLTPLSD